MPEEPSVNDRLRELADSGLVSDCTTVARLRALALAIASGDGCAEWAGVDLPAAVDLEAIAKARTRPTNSTRSADRVEIARNIIILLPVAVTWIAMSLASSAYQRALAAAPTLAPQPFLFLWQRGFDGQLAWLPFSTLARLDSVLVFVVVCLTIWLHVLTTERERQEAEALDVERRKLRGLLVDVQLALARSDSANPRQFLHQFADTARGLLQQIGDERQRLVTLAQQREREYGDLALFSAGLQTSAERMLSASERLDAAQSGLSGSMATLAQAVDASARDQQQILTAAQHAGERLQGLFTTTEELGRAIQVSLGRITSAAEQLDVVATPLSQAAQQLVALEQQLLTGMRSGGQQMLAAADAMARQTEVLSRTTEALADQLQQTMGEQSQLVQGSQRLSQQLAALGERQQELARQLATAITASVDGAAAAAQQGKEALAIAGGLLQAQRQFVDELLHEREAAMQQGRALGETLAALRDDLARVREEQARLEAQALADRTQFLTDLQGERAAMERAAATVAAAVETARLSLERTTDYARTLGGLAVNLQDFAQEFPVLIARLGDDLTRILAEQGESAATMATAAVGVREVVADLAQRRSVATAVPVPTVQRVPTITTHSG